VAELALTSPGARRELALVWVTGRPPTAPVEAFRAYVLSVRDQLPLHS
jgi:hypothetical protein